MDWMGVDVNREWALKLKKAFDEFFRKMLPESEYEEFFQ